MAMLVSGRVPRQQPVNPHLYGRRDGLQAWSVKHKGELH